MRRLLVFASAALITLALPAASRADGMPRLQMKERVKVQVKTVHRVRHRLLRRVLPPAIVALPGPYDLRADPPPPIDSAYQPAMMSYLHDPSITGYRPGSSPGVVLDDAGEHVGSVRYHHTGWARAQGPKLPPPPAIDNFPFRKYTEHGVLQYDEVIGEYVPLSARDSALAMRVANQAPQPLWPAPPR